jgi:glycosyltransferase involved in cell wall biosynthesis
MTEPLLRTAAVIIPAHDEEAVIVRTLTGVAPLLQDGIELIVAANACTDTTVLQARAVAGVQVIETAEASKAAAMNAADARARGWPRLYLDADSEISATAVRAVFAALDQGEVLAARPAFRYVTEHCSAVVRAYYRARRRIPAMSRHLWGAGAYALSEAGHERLGQFPAFVADDLYVDQLFAQSEVAIVESQPVPVRCPRTTRALVRTLQRVYAGRRELEHGAGVAAVGGVRTVLATVSKPQDLADAWVYLGIAVVAKVLARRPQEVWLRDETNRLGTSSEERGAAAVPVRP